MAGRPAVKKTDRIRAFLEQNKGKLFTAAQVRASHPSLADSNINAILNSMKSVKKTKRRIEGSIAFVFEGTEIKQPKATKAEVGNENKKEEKPLSVKQKIRSVAHRCTELERTVDKQTKQIERLNQQVETLKKAVADSLEAIEHLKSAKPAPQKKEHVDIVEEKKETTTTTAAATAEETTKVLAEISQKLAVFAELLRTLGGGGGVPHAKARSSIEEVKEALPGYEIVTRSSHQIVIEGAGAKVQFWTENGFFSGKVHDLPVRGYGLDALKGCLPAAPITTTQQPVTTAEPHP